MPLDDAEAFWILDEAVLPTTPRVDSTVNGHDFSAVSVDWETGPCSAPTAAFYDGGGKLSQASSAGLQLGDFDWEINGWGYSEGGGSTGSEGYIVKGLGFPNPICYAVYHGGPEPGKSLYIRVRNSANSANIIHSMPTGIGPDTWFNWGAYHDAANDLLGLYINAGSPVTTAWSQGVLVDAGDVYTTIVAYETERYNWRCYNMGVWRRLLSTAEREYLAGSGSECPPEWPFEDFEAASSWLASVMRTRNADDFSSQSFGTETPVVFDGLTANDMGIASTALADSDGLGPNDQAILKVRRDGDNANNADERRQTLVTVRLRVPVL